MPTFYNFSQSGVNYSFDDTFVPSDWFREGNLWTWGGAGGYGQLGNGTTPIGGVSTPVTTTAGGINWKQISCGVGHMAAIKTDGTLWTWGRGAFGQLGQNVTASSATPITTFAGGTNWKQVSSGAANTAAIKTDGTLWVWGIGSFGRNGNGITATNRLTPITTFAGGTNWQQVSLGTGLIAAAIKTDGTLWLWGDQSPGKLGNAVTTGTVSTPITTFAGGSNWKQVSLGDAHVAAIKTDGTLWTWGSGTYGRLGNASTTNRSTPVTTFTGGNNWKQVSLGDRIAAAVKTDGTLWTWGNASYSTLGNATTAPNVSTPVTTFSGGRNWKQATCAYEHIGAIKTDGTLWTWGRSNFGQLGNASTGARSTPVTTFAGGSSWKQVSFGGNINANCSSALTYVEPLI